MGRYHYHTDEDEKNIVRSMIRLDDKRKRGKIDRTETAFDKKIEAAIEAAEEEIELPTEAGKPRDLLLEKIRQNIIHGTSYERIGEVYVGREAFYKYVRRYQRLVGIHVGIYTDKKKRRGV